MDETLIIQAFATSLTNNNEIRHKAEEYLLSVQSSPGLIPILVKISLSNEHLPIKQNAAIFLKNLTKTWKDSKRDFTLTIEDKNYLKANIMYCLRYSIAEKIRSQFEEIAHNIAKADFPWTEILIQCDEALQSRDADLIHSGLDMIHQIARVYEFVMNERRNNLKVLVSRYFPIIDSLFTHLLGEENENAYKYICLILQIYWVCFYIELPEDQASKESLSSWLTKFKIILDKDLGELENPVENEDEAKIREESPQWACKRWVAQIVHRFFNRYFNLHHLNGHSRAIGEHFQSNWAVPFFESILPLLLKRTAHFIPNIVANYLLKYINQAVKFPVTCEILKAKVTNSNQLIIHLLVTDIIVPYLCRVKTDEELWEENPIEYVRKETDLSRAYYSPKSSAIDLLITLAEKGYLNQFLDYAVRELVSSPQLLKKEALLLAIGSLYQLMKENEAISQNVQNLLLTHVLPEFGSQIGFLRSRAIWMYGQFTNFPYSDPSHQQLVVQKTCQLLQDPELPVRIEAAIALPRLLIWEIAKESVGKEVGTLLNIYKVLMSEIELEELIDALEDIVSRFPKETVPYALDLSEHLTQNFLRISEKDAKDDDGDNAMAAISILNTISKIIDVLEDRNEDLVKISLIVNPILEFCLSSKGSEYFEEALHCLTSLLYYAPSGSLVHLYKYAGYLKLSLLGEGEIKPYGRDHLEEVFSPLANYISKYPQQTLANILVFFDLAIKLLKEDEQEIITGCKIFIAIIENNQGRINQALPQIVQIVWKATNTLSRKVKVIGCEVILVALWNNPIITCQGLQNNNVLVDLLSFCFENVMHFKESMARAHMIVGLGSLLYLGEQLPQIISNNLGIILQKVLTIYKGTLDEKSEFHQENNSQTPTFVDSEQLKQEYSKLLYDYKFSQKTDDSEEDSDEDNYGFSTEPEDLYDSPFESLSLKEFLKAIFTNFGAKNEEVYKGMISKLSEEDIAVLGMIMS
ncbi:unnamed protein product [Blepharisma stoltei]|uniref:Importin N-terminal domain-containing protein n=1 Tax=Blepharisma stoltei TaxID=1481888 RepID=A0AAU9IXK7_9CILI|nr:unnamed protein product [Blepharisma stoltei]